jgi:hypothetical protein
MQAQEATSPAAKMSADQAREENAYTLGVQAYQWGMPLVMDGVTLAAGLKADAVYINDFRKFDTLKTAKERFVVTPNNVTIDAYGAADVSREPQVIFVPKLSAPRWYIVQVGDYYDEVIHNIGGTKGEQPGAYVLTGPDFKGQLPGEMTEIKSRTQFVVVAARIFVNGSADLPMRIFRTFGVGMVGLVLLAGCKKTADNSMNYKSAIDAWYSAHPSCLWSSSQRFPVQVGASNDDQNAPFAALVDQGLLVRSTSEKKIIIVSRQRSTMTSATAGAARGLPM